MRVPRPLVAFALMFALAVHVAPAHAEEAAHAEDAESAQLSLVDVNPYGPLIRGQYYSQLRKSPARAFFYELAVPGLGFAYVGFKAQAIVSASASVLFAGLWVAGAVADRDPLRYAGIAGFAAARLTGVVAAPGCALLLNAAFRRRLGVQLAYAF